VLFNVWGTRISEWMNGLMWSIGGMILIGENGSTRIKTCRSATVSTWDLNLHNAVQKLPCVWFILAWKRHQQCSVTVRFIYSLELNLNSGPREDDAEASGCIELFIAYVFRHWIWGFFPLKTLMFSPDCATPQSEYSPLWEPQIVITPGNWVLTDKLTIPQLVKIVFAFYGTRRFITVFTKACYLFMSWAKTIHSTRLHQRLMICFLQVSQQDFVFSFSQVRVILLALISSLEQASREYGSWRSPLRFVYITLTFSDLGPNVFLSTILLKILKSLFFIQCDTNFPTGIKQQGIL
jgi:hypothetical protein